MLANFFWYAALAGALYLLWRYLNWRHDWFVATDKRFLLFYGFIRRKVAMMPLTKVTDMTFDRSIMGRIIGYGTFLLESAGQDQALGHIEYVPDAERHYRAICTVLFGSTDAAGRPRRRAGTTTRTRRRRTRRPRRRRGDGPAAARAPPTTTAGRTAGRTRTAGATTSGGTSARPAGGRHTQSCPGPARLAPPHETLYRSSDLLHASRLEDTGEIPVIRPRSQRRSPDERAAMSVMRTKSIEQSIARG